MADSDSQNVLELFADAFDGFDGCILVGGTRMVKSDDLQDVVFGITEVGPAIRRANTACYVLGVIPRGESFTPLEQGGLIVRQTETSSNQPDRKFVTIVHPDQNLVVAVIKHLTPNEIWDDEVEFCRYVTSTLVRYGGWKSLLVAYNGGSVTEREIRSTAERQDPVLLVRGSGRICDTLARDTAFLQAHPSVNVCDRNPEDLRRALYHLNALRFT